MVWYGFLLCVRLRGVRYEQIKLRQDGGNEGIHFFPLVPKRVPIVMGRWSDTNPQGDKCAPGLWTMEAVHFSWVNYMDVQARNVLQYADLQGYEKPQLSPTSPIVTQCFSWSPRSTP
jgi:hypothetical protein